MQTLWQDLRYGARMLLKNPGLMGVAVFTLALGIGANTAIFSVAYGVLLKPLPYKDPERLAFIRSDWRGVSGQAGIAAAEVMDFRQQSKLFEGFEVIMSNNSSLTGEPMEKIRSATVTERFLPLLGVQPYLGGLPDKANKVWDVVISYELWQRWQALKADVNESLKEGGRQPSRGRGRLRNGLVVMEVALSLVLLVGAGLMMRTFAKINQLDWGFKPDNLLTLQVSLQPRGFPEVANRWQFYQQALEKVRTMPGVESVSGVSPMPLTEDGMISSYALDEAAAAPLSASSHTVLPDYFRTMGIRLIYGRDFTPLEIEQKLPLVIVDANLARSAWPNENPVGKKLLWRPRTRGQQWLEVVGVAEHTKAGGFREVGRPQLYLPYQSYPLFDLSLVVRGKTDPLALGPTIKREIEQMGTRRPAHA